MPAYSYKERFVPLVLNRSKTQTIRKRRKKGFAKPGDTLYHYFGLRTKYCRKLGESICKEVKTILIRKDGAVIIYDKRLSDIEAKKALEGALRGNFMSVKLTTLKKNILAKADGFYGDWSTMYRWWQITHELPFIGDLIKWDKNSFKEFQTARLVKNKP